MSDSTMILALFAGIGDLFLALTLKKPKENICVWLPTLKNEMKINVLALLSECLSTKVVAWVYLWVEF